MPARRLRIETVIGAVRGCFSSRGLALREHIRLEPLSPQSVHDELLRAFRRSHCRAARRSASGGRLRKAGTRVIRRSRCLTLRSTARCCARSSRGCRDIAGSSRSRDISRPQAGVGPEVRYLSRLIGHARRRGDTSGVRILPLSRPRGGAQAGARRLPHRRRRNPLQQWLSCRSYRGEVPLAYFELCHFLILALAPAGSPAQRFAGMLGLPRLPRGLARQYKLPPRRSLPVERGAVVSRVHRRLSVVPRPRPKRPPIWCSMSTGWPARCSTATQCARASWPMSV